MEPEPSRRDGLPIVATTFHSAVTEFKRRLLEATLTQAGGNRTRAARSLGLQRTYLLRLIREFDIRVPPAALPGARPRGAALGRGRIDTRRSAV
ncbi:MAG: hypothetical protein L0027_11295 [Candidatus Rokubacteria bacterium]|nr:hypothetical protein [Candidatus Rokubacteria bacterium]